MNFHGSYAGTPVVSAWLGGRKRGRRPSAYNLFLKKEMLRLKEAEPSLTHKQTFAKAAATWTAMKAEAEGVEPSAKRKKR